LVDQPPFPWIYPYQAGDRRLDMITYRPLVSIQIVGADVSNNAHALVDSGCTHILAASWLADSAGVDPKASGRQLRLGIGGDWVDVEFADVTLRLIAPGGDDRRYFEWQAEVGFLKRWQPPWPVIAGQVGFMDQFTVTPSLYAKHTAIELNTAFDDRYQTPLA
jgi:hypothetical protein